MLQSKAARLSAKLLDVLYAVLATVAASVIRLAVAPWLFESATFIPFVLAILLTGWLRGWWPSFLTTTFSGLVAAYGLFPPYYSIWVDSASDRVQLGLFWVTGLAISFIYKSMHSLTRVLEAKKLELEREINERKSLQKVERGLLGSIVESSSDAIISTSRDGTVRTWNASAERIFGFTLDDAIGQSLQDLISSHGIEEEFIQTQIGAGHRIESYEMTRVRKDGRIVPISLTISPIKDEAGNSEGVSWIARDISEHKSLRESEERMRLATEATGVGLWEWNLFTNHISWDDQLFRIYRVPPTENGIVPYKTWSDAVVPEDLRKSEEVLQDTIRRLGHSRRVFRIRRPGELDYRYIEAVETIRTNSRGQAEWVVGTNLDISERKLAEEELKRLNESLEKQVAERTTALSERERRLRVILNTAADTIITMDRGGFIQIANPTTEEMFGYSQKELVGQNVKMLLPMSRFEEFVPQLEGNSRTGEATRIGIGREVSGRRKDGSNFPAEIAVSRVDPFNYQSQLRISHFRRVAGVVAVS